MSAISFVRKALAMGVDLETALKMGEAFEAEMPVYVPPVNEPKADRRRRMDRERKQRLRHPNADNADIPRTSAISADKADISANHADKSGQTRAPTYTRGENNLSRLEDNSSAVAVVAETREPGFDWPPGKAADHAKILVELARSPRFDPAKQLGLVTTTGRLDAWRREGASWEHDVVPIVTSGVARKTGPPINSWKFFDPAIAQSIADNRRALDIPAANGPRHEQPPRSAKFDAKQANMERALRGAEIMLGRRAV